MKRNITAIAIVATLSAAITSFAVEQGKKQPPRLTPEKLEQMQMKRFGGFIKDTRNQRGSITIVNAQTAAKEEWFAPALAEFDEYVHVQFEIKAGKFDLASPQVQGSASVFVVDDPALPMSLVAPESRWTMINIAKIKTEKPAFFEARTKKMLVRSLAYLMGAADSQYPMCLTGCITKAEDLDRYPMTSLPVEVLNKLEKYIAGYGVLPWKRSTYKKAVRDGWAHQPTNECQKAIWDELHEIPTEPMLIKPEKHPAK